MTHNKKELEATIDGLVVHIFHLLYIIDSEKHKIFKKFFDSTPRGVEQHFCEMLKSCAESGSRVAQTGNCEDIRH